MKVFFKGNLRPSLEKRVLGRWREEMPVGYEMFEKTPPAGLYVRNNDSLPEQLSLFGGDV